MGKLSLEFLTVFSSTSALMMLFTPKASAAVCFLLSVFCSSALLLLCFDLEFLAYALITIYVGAVAILLLFVLKVLHASDELPGISFSNSFFQTFAATVCAFFCFLAGYVRYLSLAEGFFFFNLAFNQAGHTFVDNFYGDSIAILGTVLYSHYGVLLLVAGFILLLGMVSAIAVVLNSDYYIRFRHLRKTRLKSNRFVCSAPLKGLYYLVSLVCPFQLKPFCACSFSIALSKLAFF